MNVLERFSAMEYGPAPESRIEADAWLTNKDFARSLFIDGEWRAAAGGKTFPVEEPATGKRLAEVSDGSADDVDAAVQAARAALPGWRKKSGFERAKVLYALGRMMQRNARLFAVLESIDNGKPIRESRDIDVPLAIRHFLHHAGWAQRLAKEFPGRAGAGVCGQIIPWNFPLLMLAWKVAPALAAGCTVVLKPAEQTPLTAILFAGLCERAGVPKGVFNLVTGGPAAGVAITGHPDIDKIAFTGSSEVGKLIREATAGSGKKLSLELGGKSAFLVFEDADLDSAVEGLVDGIWFNQGQVCCAGSRLLVQESIAEALLAKVRARMSTLRLGSPLDKNTDIGPLVDRTQLERVKRLVAEGAEQGAQIWQPACPLPETGTYFVPTLAEVSPSNVLAQEEVFGPVLAVMTFRNTEEAIELANNTRYGLAASVWSENLNLALHVAPQLKAGVVWVNGTNLFDAACGFGGFRESGFGREGGREGLEEYLKDPPLLGPEIATGGAPPPAQEAEESSGIDRTPKLFIGGKQVRPDGNYAFSVYDSQGRVAGEAGAGNRKDVRDAVSAARAATKSWGEATGFNRAQVLYFLAENLSARAAEFASRLASFGTDGHAANAEVEQSIERLFAYAAIADKYEGRVHNPPMRAVTLALHEPVGTLGIVLPDDAPLLSFVSLAGAALSQGNPVVVVPSQKTALVATDLYQVIQTSDVPAGAVNIVTGVAAELTGVLARHDDLDALWVVADGKTCADAEKASAGNLKRVWTSGGKSLDWTADGLEEAFLRRSVEIKNVWVPYGD